MTRDDLLKRICPRDRIFDCCNEYTDEYCDGCKRIMNEWLDEYDKHVIEQYKANTNFKDTIKDIHDNVAQEMYCKGVDDLCDEISTYRMYDKYGNVIDLLEIAKRLKENK